jgi:EmrB/QacA subfamily drug resistance transporter
MTAYKQIDSRQRYYIIVATLLALFLSALDTLIMSAAMPTVVADLGGLHLYSWVFSTYLLSRAVALPVFGKLSDLFPNRTLYIVAILIFLAGSILAGFAQTMLQLTLARVVQGIGAGGNFALVYIVLADIAKPGERGKMMSLGSFVWGLASVLGPSFGGFIVGYATWRWIFFINVPIGIISLVGIYFFLSETRSKHQVIVIDYAGILTLTITILAFLTAFLLGGRQYSWVSPQVAGLLALSLLAAVGFYHVEKRAREPLLSFAFFRQRGFSCGNGLVFFSSFAIFSLSAFSPLFIQGALGKSPAQLGIVMVFLSLGWSLGALYCGRQANRYGEKQLALAGALILIVGCAMAVFFSETTGLGTCAVALALAGIGMGFSSIASLLIVQNSVANADLGVATSTHQFARTLGGTVGIGICGSIVTLRFYNAMQMLTGKELRSDIPPSVAAELQRNFENFFRPDVQEQLSAQMQLILHRAIGQSVIDVFWVALSAAFLCLLFACLLPKSKAMDSAAKPTSKRQG